MAKYGPKLTGTGRRRLNVRFNSDPVMVAVADGLFAIAMRIGEVAAAAAPDAPELNYGLPENWGAGAWANGKLIDGFGATSGEAFSKPRGTGPVPKVGAAAVIGFGFPGRFNELGTVNQPARPFLGPAALHMASSPEFAQLLRDHFPKGDKP